jgi:histidine triad (HIT) family protein
MTGVDCIFCQIVRGAAPASIVHEDEHTLAFMDIQPVTSGHLLVIPKQHAASLADLPPGSGGRLTEVAVSLAAALRRTDLRCEGVNLFLADGEAAGQEVFHVHLHVFPRYAGDGFGLRITYPAQPPDHATLDQHAAAIGAAALRE